jgi:hypothetical protein
VSQDLTKYSPGFWHYLLKMAGDVRAVAGMCEKQHATGLSATGGLSEQLL